MSQHIGLYATRTEAIICARCGVSGALDWEDVPHDNGEVSRELVRIAGDFYERLSKKPPHPIELVCNSCGTVQSPPSP